LVGILSFAFRVSRFRFWIYLAGTYVVGYSLGMDSWRDLLAPTYVVFLAYFFLPANIFLYGVNDYWDERTDRDNPKKARKENMLCDADRRRLLGLLTLVALLSLALIVAMDSVVERAVLASFLGLSFFYSSEPLRFKSRPILDFASNSLYVMPGILGFHQASGSLPVLPMIIAGVMHTSAMHLFSAIPDIEYDRKAGIVTTAVVLRRNASLGLCAIFWTLLSLLAIHLTHYSAPSFAVFVYPSIPLVVLLREGLDIDRVYWYWPYVNTAMGGGLFLASTLAKLHL